MLDAFKKDLQARFYAGDALLYVETGEYERIKKILTTEIAPELFKRGESEHEYKGEVTECPIIEWSGDQGWVQIYPLQLRIGNDSENPLNAIKMIPALPEGIYLLPLGHLLFASDANNLDILQCLINIVPEIEASFRRLVIISPTYSLPKEIEHLFTHIVFPLPDREELNILFRRVVNSLKNDARLKNIEIQIPSSETEQACVEAAIGLGEREALNILTYAYRMSSPPRGWDPKIILKEKASVVRKSGFLEYFATTESFGTVGGLDEVKEYIRKRAKAFTPAAREQGLPYPKGILLGGPPRVGKSLIAKAISNEFKSPLILFDVSRVMGKYLGEAAENINKVIRLIETIGNAVLWIDECEKALSGMSPSQITDSAGAEVSRALGRFLTWMQERDTNKGIYIILTCNNVLALPPEFAGKGRIDEIFWVDLPTLKERVEIFKIHLLKQKRAEYINDTEIEELAQISNGFNGAEIEEAIITAMYDAFDLDDKFTEEHIKGAIQSTTPLSIIRKEEMDRMREWQKQHHIRSASSEIENSSIERERKVYA